MKLIMGVLYAEKCCCCIQLRTGGLILGWLGLINSILGFGSALKTQPSYEASVGFGMKKDKQITLIQ